MKHYAVIGRGDGNKRVIVSSLADLPEAAVFHIRWTGEPTPAEEVVLDWLIDNEKSFVVYGQNVPKGLARYAEGVEDGGLAELLKGVAGAGGDTGLVLWDDSAENEVIAAAAALPHLLELTNGLTPIDVEDDEPAPAQDTVLVLETVYDEPGTPEASEFFTRSELENMPAAAVKRQAKERGLDITGLVKSEVIDLLLGEASAPASVVEPEPLPVADGTDVFALAKKVQDLEKQINDIYDNTLTPLAAEREKTVKEIGKILGFEF